MSKIQYEYEIPKSLRNGTQAAKVTMRPLTTREEIDASKAGGFDLMKTQYEAVKRSICALDGKSASIMDGEVDKFWEEAGPKLRSLLLQAHNRLSSANMEESDSFFASEQVRVG